MATRGSGENARISSDASRPVQRAHMHLGAATARSAASTTISWLVIVVARFTENHHRDIVFLMRKL